MALRHQHCGKLTFGGPQQSCIPEGPGFGVPRFVLPFMHVLLYGGTKTVTAAHVIPRAAPGEPNFIPQEHEICHQVLAPMKSIQRQILSSAPLLSSLMTEADAGLELSLIHI